MATFVEEKLENGLRLCLEPLDHLPSAACGFLVRTGARDERPEEEGVSHFLEHMCFKGTANATWEQINQRFDELGSKYNAFTGHEKTMYYGWVPAENLAGQTALLAEMMRSTVPQQEFDTEKKVVLEEIAMYRDSLESCMFDLALKELFAGSSLAFSVLGTEETIGPLSRQQMLDYHRRRYCPENMIFAATGAIDPSAVIEHVRALTAAWPAGDAGRQQPRPTLRGEGVVSQRIEKFTQQAAMLCYPAPPAASNDPRPTVLSRILSGANSRIFWDVIQRGVCPDAGSFYLDYSDIGVFVLYALCEPERVMGALDALRAVAREVCADGPRAQELERVKNMARTRVARDGDAPMRRLMQLANDIDVLQRPRTLEEQLQQIEALTVGDINHLLREHPIDGEGVLVSVGPAEWPPAA